MNELFFFSLHNCIKMLSFRIMIGKLNRGDISLE